MTVNLVSYNCLIIYFVNIYFLYYDPTIVDERNRLGKKAAEHAPSLYIEIKNKHMRSRAINRIHLQIARPFLEYIIEHHTQ